MSRMIWMCVLAINMANAQYMYELKTWAGVPCGYGPYTSSAGQAGCSGSGGCWNGRHLEVSWYQDWVCDPSNYVTVSGSSYLTYIYADNRNYPAGMMADGDATVYTAGSASDYQGWDEANCDGFVDYSGPYYYRC